MTSPSASTTMPAYDGRPVVPRTGALTPLGVGEVRITGGFWGERQELNRTIIDHIEHWQEREGWIANFDAAAQGTLPAARRGREFSDSEPYKLLEAMAWHLAWHEDRELAARYDAIVARIAAAQEPDGYLNTMFGRPGQEPRWSDLEWGHELYCLGHLMQSAVARVRTGHPDDTFVQVARRAADLVCEVFGADGNPGVCGHPEIEVGLAELGRALGEPRYLKQAARFIDRRGHGALADIEWGRSYYQDDVPIREAKVFRGHAVRANYLAAGAVDVGVETGDRELVEAIIHQWERTISARTYLTGGQGSRHQDEGFGEDFQLPPDRAYSETCASVGSVMVAWRLLLSEGQERFADFIERSLFNVVATSPAADGRSFYYSNTLHQRVPGEVAAPDVVSKRAESSLRAPFFEVSCCPPNVARTFASLAAYLATVSDAGVQLHQYAPAEIRTTLPDGAPVALDVVTEFPAQGAITVRVVDAPGRPWTLTLRVPEWSPSATVRVSHAGEPAVERTAGSGTVDVEGLAVGDEVTLLVDVTPRFLVADARIDAVRGCVAVQRGPEVMCLESVDLPDGAPTDVAEVCVDPSVAPRVVNGATVVRAHGVEPAAQPWPYLGSAGEPGAAQVAAAGFDVPLVPYHDWANRGPSTMRVWLPTR